MERIYSIATKNHLFSKKVDIMLINEFGNAVWGATVANWNEKEGEPAIDRLERVVQTLKSTGKEKNIKIWDVITVPEYYPEEEETRREKIYRDLLDRWDTIGLESVDQALELSGKIHEWIKCRTK